MSFSLIILAGGNSHRFKSSIGKPYQKIAGKSLIEINLNKARKIKQIKKIVLVYNKKDLKKVKTVPYKHNYGYFFTSGPDTWHGMEKKKILKERRCIQVNYVTFPTDWKVE